MCYIYSTSDRKISRCEKWWNLIFPCKHLNYPFQTISFYRQWSHRKIYRYVSFHAYKVLYSLGYSCDIIQITRKPTRKSP
jgi:hypothetical protein